MQAAVLVLDRRGYAAVSLADAGWLTEAGGAAEFDGYELLRSLAAQFDTHLQIPP